MNEQIQKKVSYTCVLLNPESRRNLLEKLNIGNGLEMAGWEIIAHHMTINMGGAENGPAEDWLGNEVVLTATTFAENDKVMAVGVKSIVPSNNEIPHITIAVNRANGGKPFLSNKLTKWKPITPITLNGIVSEI